MLSNKNYFSCVRYNTLSKERVNVLHQTMPGPMKINSKFAEKYEKYRQKEELQRLKDRYGHEADQSESGSSDSSSDDSEVELDPKLERDFYRTLSLLKKKDPKIYQEDAKFYTEEDESTSKSQPSTSKAIKPMYLKDYERKVILEKGGKYEDDDDDEEDYDDEEAAKRRERAASPSYIQEQKELKESLRKFVQESDEEDTEGESHFLTRRIKTQEEKAHEEEDYVEWLKGQKEWEGPEEVQDMKYLRDYWNDPELDKKERFLRDFVLNKTYLDDEHDDDRIPTYDEVVQDDVDDSEEEGESFLRRQEDFERSYNFRYEEPDALKIKTYPRNIATSVRSKDDRRKTKREEVKERKIKEKELKQEQLKQLKNLKRIEIMEKLQKLKELTGNEQLAFNQEDLEEDFDSLHHDQFMQKLYGVEFYGDEDGEKPQFDDNDELEDHWNWDTWTGEGEEKDCGGEEEKYEAQDPNCEDPDFIMDADYDPSQHTASKKKKKKERQMKKKEDATQMGKKRKKSHFAEVVTAHKEKPIFDPQEKSYEKYLDEYYKLDYEDIIDDLPCRFRYREVLANDFGLTAGEVMRADDKELNRWCSLKKTCMFRTDREELGDLKNYEMRAKNEKKKRQILSSLYTEEDEEEPEGTSKVTKNKRDRLQNAEKQGSGAEEDGEPGTSLSVSGGSSAEGTLGKAVSELLDVDDNDELLMPKKKMKLEENSQSLTADEESAGQAEEGDSRTGGPKRPNKKYRHPGGRLISRSIRVKMGGREFSGQRLKAFGLNPKRLLFRQLHKQKRKTQEKMEKNKSKV